MTAKPSQYIAWCPDGDPAKIQQPPSALSDAGWIGGQVPIAQHFNWLLYTVDQWIRWLEQMADAATSQGTFLGVRPVSMRAINGGTWSWNATTGVLSWSAAWQLGIPGLPAASNNVPAGSVTLADGQVAYVAPNLPITVYGDTTSGSASVVNVTDMTGITVGMSVYGPQIPASTVVSSIAGNSVTLSQNATGTVAGAYLTFGFGGNLTTYVFADSAFVAHGSPKVVFARRVGNVVHVGAAGTTMVLQSTESRVMGVSTDSFTAVAGETLTAGQWVYLSPGAADGGRTAGRAYRTDAGSTNGAVRAHCAGVVVTGASAGASVLVANKGIAYTVSGLSAGTPYYLDPATLGAITATAPSGSQQWLAKVGVALGANSLLVDISRPSQQAALVTRTYFTHFANAMISDDTSAVSLQAIVAAGNLVGYVRVNLTGAGTALAMVPLRLPSSGTIVAGSFDVSIESGTPNTSVSIVRMDNNDTCTTIIGGTVSGGPFTGPASVGTVPWTFGRYTMGTLSQVISSGDYYYAQVQWAPTAAAVSRWIGFRFDVSTSDPFVTAG